MLEKERPAVRAHTAATRAKGEVPGRSLERAWLAAGWPPSWVSVQAVFSVDASLPLHVLSVMSLVFSGGSFLDGPLALTLKTLSLHSLSCPF